MLTAEVPASQEQVRARHILVDDETKANLIYEMAVAGTRDWADLAAQFSTDASNADEGGYLGWFGKGAMVAEFEQAAFAAAAGEITKPVKTSFGWHVIQVLDKGQRPLDASQLQEARTQAFEDWLKAQREALDAACQPVVQSFDNWFDQVPTEPALPQGG